MDWAALALSLQLAVCTTLILCCIGLPLAYWLVVTKWRWKFLLEAVVALPLVLPPTVLGFYILIAIGPHSPIGQGYTALTQINKSNVNKLGLAWMVHTSAEPATAPVPGPVPVRCRLRASVW